MREKSQNAGWRPCGPQQKGDGSTTALFGAGLLTPPKRPTDGSPFFFSVFAPELPDDEIQKASPYLPNPSYALFKAHLVWQLRLPRSLSVS